MPCYKIPYESKSEALKDAKLIKVHNKHFKQSIDKGKRLRPYECPYCSKWHLTSQKFNKT